MTIKQKAERIGSKIVRREGHFAVPTNEHWYPACKQMHSYAVEQPFRHGARWTFNGNGDVPDFKPSMNISGGPFPDGRIERCHYFVTAGRIQYCGDSTHAMAGQPIDLSDIPQERLLLMVIIA